LLISWEDLVPKSFNMIVYHAHVLTA